MKIVSKPQHGDIIGYLNDKPIHASEAMQIYLDDLEQRLNTHLLGKAVIPPPYTVATVPDATKYERGIIYVSDESGGKTLAFSDGVDWRRVQDRAVIS